MTAQGAAATTEVRRQDGVVYAHRDGAAPPLLLLHGWGTDSSSLWPVAARLPDRRAIAPDLPGHGASPPPPVGAADGRGFGTADYAAAIAALCRAEAGDDDDVAWDVIAHSFGAQVAVVLAAEGRLPIRRLLLTGAAGLRRPAGQAAPAPARPSVRLARAAGRHGGPLGRVVKDAVYERVGSDDYRQSVRDGVRETFVRVVNEDIRPLLSRVAAPTLLVWGDRDEATRVARGAEMAELIPDAALVTFAGRGHYAFAEEPDRFAAIARAFLAPPDPRMAA